MTDDALAIVQAVARRVATLVATLLVASVLIYGALFLAPGDPAQQLAGGTVPSPEALEAIRAQYHLDEPFPAQYWHWISGLVQGDLGQSIAYRSSVSSLVSARAGVTATLVIYASVLILVMGVGSGIVAALRPGRTNSAVTLATTIALGVPTFVVAIVLIWVFSSGLSWFPVYGAGEGFVDRIWHLTLPAVSLALTFMAYVSRVTRTAVSAELTAEHVMTARSRGISRRDVLVHHVLRNASAPVLTVSGLTVAGLLAGSAVAEQAFGVNGLGSLLVQAATLQDYSVVLAVSMLVVGAFVIINSAVDIVNAVIDPRISSKASR